MKEMVAWLNEGYIDPGIWDYLRTKTNPALIPAPSVLENQFLPQLQYPVNKLICSCDTLNPGFFISKVVDICSKEICA